MSTDFLRNRKVLLATAGVLILGLATWGVAALSRGNKTTLPKELSAAALKAEADPGKVMQRVHEAMERGNLTDEQRHEVWENAHTVMEAQMDKRLDEYFTANESQRPAILDRQLDEMQAHMREWQQRRGQSDRQGSDRGPASGQRGPANATASGRAGGPPRDHGPGFGGDHRGGGDHHWGPPTHEQRKQHFESRDPDRTARRTAYFAALSQRAEQRGIQMPWAMGPPHGGPGR